MAEAKSLMSKMQEGLLSGRKLTEDLQTDKRIDRQLLLELRAQPSPLRSNGRAHAVLSAPNAVPSAPSNTSLQIPKVTLRSSSLKSPPSIPPSMLSSGGSIRPEVASPIVRLPPANPESRPVVRLPPPPPTKQENPSRLPTRSSPPVHASRGPKGWRPNTTKPA